MTIDLTKPPYNADPTGKNPINGIIRLAESHAKEGDLLHLPEGVYLVDVKDGEEFKLDNGIEVTGKTELKMRITP